MEDARRDRPWKGAIACHTLELLALAIWIGGLAIILCGLIPEAFNLGMETGGRLLTRVFGRYNMLVLGAMGVLIGMASLRTWVSVRHGHAAVSLTLPEWSLLGLMMVLALTLTFVLFPSSIQMQEQAFAANSEDAKQDAYKAFFRSHNLVRILYLVNLGLGIALVTVKIRGWVHQRSTTA